MNGYPVFLNDLDQRSCVVVGGGHEAARKVDGLLECDARVTVIAPTLVASLRALADAGKVGWTRRGYRRGDLEGVFLVIAAEQCPETNEEIWKEARSTGCLVNVMDDTEHCNFIAGSVLRRGALTVAISTGGCAPALAVRLRQRLQSELGPEYAEFLRLMSELREPLRRRYPDFEQRRALWYALVDDAELIGRLRFGRPDLARVRIWQLVGEPDPVPQMSGPHPARNR